jgi:hypothetical protein
LSALPQLKFWYVRGYRLRDRFAEEEEQQQQQQEKEEQEQENIYYEVSENFLASFCAR